MTGFGLSSAFGALGLDDVLFPGEHDGRVTGGEVADALVGDGAFTQRVGDAGDDVEESVRRARGRADGRQVTFDDGWGWRCCRAEHPVVAVVESESCGADDGVADARLPQQVEALR